MEENLRVGEGAAGGGVGGDGADRGEDVVEADGALGMRCAVEFDDELDGADAIERGDGAAGHDGEVWRE